MRLLRVTVSLNSRRIIMFRELGMITCYQVVQYWSGIFPVGVYAVLLFVPSL
jgi:hypothetical protein